MKTFVRRYGPAPRAAFGSGIVKKGSAAAVTLFNRDVFARVREGPRAHAAPRPPDHHERRVHAGPDFPAPGSPAVPRLVNRLVGADAPRHVFDATDPHVVVGILHRDA